jgi:hypothetical protein
MFIFRSPARLYRLMRNWRGSVLESLPRALINPLLSSVFIVLVTPVAILLRLRGRGHLPGGGWRDVAQSADRKSSYQKML